MIPRVFDVVLAGLSVDSETREVIIGDLVEEQAEFAATLGQSFANRWLISQVLRSLPLLTHQRLRAGGPPVMMKAVGAGLVALLTMLVVSSASAAVFFAAFSEEALVRFAIFAFAIDLGYGVIGGYLAARLARVAPLVSSLSCGILAVVFTVVASGGAVPEWYALALQILLIPAAMTGGWLRARRLVTQR
ncbi:MAG TPA: hypothetical protein VFD64_11120 [Gemmatimonadaceae bacterium]|nr:hypothetical protein [Gemmatimonadaceae bacterium]